MHKKSQSQPSSASKKTGAFTSSIPQPGQKPISDLKPELPIGAKNSATSSLQTLPSATLTVGDPMTGTTSTNIPETAPTTGNTIKVTSYQMYVQARQQRETRIFLTIGGVMAICLVVSLFIFFGILRIPFLEGFKSPPKYAMSGSVPCPLSDSPVAADKLKVKVLNASEQKGLAKEVAQRLKELKINVISVGNSVQKDMRREARIVTGPTGVNGAYTLARAFTDVEIIMDTRQSTDLTLILGDDFQTTRSPEEFKAEANQPLEDLPKCAPVRLV